MSVQMSGGVHPQPSFKAGGEELIVEPDETQIYGRGKLHSIGVDDVVNNRIACQMVFNDVTSAKREVRAARDEIRRLDYERGQVALRPAMLLMFGAVAIIGGVLIAIGVNLIMKPEVSSIGWAITILGGASSLIGSLAPTALSMARPRTIKGDGTHSTME